MLLPVSHSGLIYTLFTPLYTRSNASSDNSSLCTQVIPVLFCWSDALNGVCDCICSVWCGENNISTILGFTKAFFPLRSDAVKFVVFFLIFPWCCVFIGSLISFLCCILFHYIFTVI